MTNLESGKHTVFGEHAHGHEDGAGHGHAHMHADGTWHSHSHDHGESPAHGHSHEGATTTVVELNKRILAKNDQAADRNRAWFKGREILALNLMSAPGAGKTTLLERTIAEMKTQQKIFVLEGDQATDRDGARVKAAGASAVQINTGSGCHLDAEMVARGLGELKPEAGSLLFIENVGNLVCPALFDLGENRRVAILSVTEGDDKPIKYPHMFRAAGLMLLNKIDLLPHVDFDIERAVAHAKEVNPNIEVLRISAKTGEGMAAWQSWIRSSQTAARAGAFA
ncbi:MAG TPA: hydrogenase nickel incorporation protein HypB [Rhizomicrobium sp.]|jgi:hydrogenase nickel incorporation protein HypB|nr:hydrogenase nickel incorporation protein HypB [Rhizomicrobium sp.]